MRSTLNPDFNRIAGQCPKAQPFRKFGGMREEVVVTGRAFWAFATGAGLEANFGRGGPLSDAPCSVSEIWPTKWEWNG